MRLPGIIRTRPFEAIEDMTASRKESWLMDSAWRPFVESHVVARPCNMLWTRDLVVKVEIVRCDRGDVTSLLFCGSFQSALKETPTTTTMDSPLFPSTSTPLLASPPATPSASTSMSPPTSSALSIVGHPIVSPYTPAPSPTPSDSPITAGENERYAEEVVGIYQRLDSHSRKLLLSELIGASSIEELVYVSNVIAPRLKRDFLRELPVELALHVISYVDDPRTLARASCVSRFWRSLLQDEYTWKTMCIKHNFGRGMKDAYRSAMQGVLDGSVPSSPNWETALGGGFSSRMSVDGDSDTDRTAQLHDLDPDIRFSSLLPASSSRSSSVNTHRPPRLHRPPVGNKRGPASSKRPKLPIKVEDQFSYRKYFKLAYLTEANWRRGGRVLKSHTSQDDGVVTSVAMNEEWIVAGLVNHRIHVFAADSGVHVRTLVGHTQGVWCLNLISKGGSPAAATHSVPPTASTTQTEFHQASTSSGLGFAGSETRASSVSTMVDSDDESHPMFGLGDVEEDRPQFGTHLKPSDVCNTSIGWGQNTSLVVSGGCDRDLRVWDLHNGYCLYALKGHTSTIRCLKVLDGRPIAISGSRDATLRVWDIQKGRCLHILSGHTNSVRCLDVAGNLAVSGSYDCTARLWNVDTGECLRVFEGHYHQIYAVAFDGVRVATGSLDSTVRVWSPETGEGLALLQGHTSLVGQLQLQGDVLVSGGSDGRVIIFSLTTFATLFRLCAHDNSVTCLQFDDRFLITGGNDGHVKLFEMGTGLPIRELTEPCEAVWRVNFKHDKCVIMCKRGGKTVMEILSFRPTDETM
ncbi:hypothetical protein FRC02_012216 [Tulasnella sp. 418]|nr:hypothetical protein FRC02_012216 [Tulasnella sp. 418]